MRATQRHRALLPAIIVVMMLACAPETRAQNVPMTGFWFNNTFGSTGDANAQLIITLPTVSFTLDLDGFVFGFVDPGPITLNGVINPDMSIDFDPVVGHATYGDVTASVDSSGVFTALAANVPAAFITQVSLTGPVSAGGLDLEYHVFDDSGEFADGVIVLNVVPEPVTGAVAGLGGLLLARRRRVTGA